MPETNSVPGRLRARAEPQLVGSGPVKMIVSLPEVSKTETRLTNGALLVSNISISVANMTRLKRTYSHSGAISSVTGAHANELPVQLGATLAGPVACIADHASVLYCVEAVAWLAHCAVNGSQGGGGGSNGAPGCMGGSGGEPGVGGVAGGIGGGGRGGDRHRVPQSVQSSAKRHDAYSLPAPPSSHSPSRTCLHAGESWQQARGI
eukprot:6425875-Prymnesium_polylepis.1